MKPHILRTLCALVIILLADSSSSLARDLSFLSFESRAMTHFTLPFKQYIAAYKVFIEKDKGINALERATRQWVELQKKARVEGAGPEIMGRMHVINGMLIQAHGLALQDRYDEAKEVSIPIRTELYELHNALDMLTAEDYMIYMHNGLLHRAEPLIAQGRYDELSRLMPRIEKTMNRFKNPPKNIVDQAKYTTRFKAFSQKIQAYFAAVNKANTYVDPEYGAFMMHTQLEKAHKSAHKNFGALYLGFPEGMIWPKKMKQPAG